MKNSIEAQKLNWGSIPLIDLSPWFNGNDDEKKAVAKEVISACCTTGFLYIVNHRIPQPLLEEVFKGAKAFFELPLNEKQKVSFEKTNKNRGYIPFGVESSDPKAKRDEKEAYDFTYMIPKGAIKGPQNERVRGENLWSENPYGLKPAIEKYMRECITLGRELFKIFALGLGLEENYFDNKVNYPIAQLRLLFYPAQDPNKTSTQNLGIGRHCDYECLTILAQDDLSGLQVQNLEGNWVEVPPIEGTYVINIGEMLTRWTNGLFKATPHRVVNVTEKNRYSIPFFFATNYDVNIKPLDVCISNQNPSQFEDIKAGDYLLNRLEEVYG